MAPNREAQMEGAAVIPEEIVNKFNFQCSSQGEVSLSLFPLLKGPEASVSVVLVALRALKRFVFFKVLRWVSCCFSAFLARLGPKTPQDGPNRMKHEPESALS